MAEEEFNGAEYLTRWRRIARLLLHARSLVLTQGSAVIVKWDGHRDTGRIYTVVWEGDADTGSRFRAETDDLEKALIQAFSPDISSEFEATSSIADLLAKIDSAARRHLVVSIRMSRTQDAVNDHLVILGQGKRGLVFDHKSESLVAVLREAVGFIEKEPVAKN